jgi:hypothetical protein
VMRRFPTLGSMLCVTLLLNRIWPGNPWNRRYRYGDIDYGRPQSVNQPAGAALAFRREVWEQLGGFDEQFYPVWFEDVDFCRRIRQHGWDIVYEPNAVFTHQGGHSVRRLSFSEQQLFWYRNLLRYFRKYHSGAEVLTLRIAIIIGMAIRSAAVLAGVGPSCVSREEALRAFRLVFHQCVLNTGECSATSQRSSKNFTS